MGAPILALLLAGCAASPSAELPPAPVSADGRITVRAEPVPEFDGRATQVAVCASEPCGEWTYAGGLRLTSADTSRLHGLSDLELDPGSGRLLAPVDDGDLLEARLVLDDEGRPAGLADVRIAPLRDPSGRSISGDKTQGDAEGIARLSNGDLLVSFERDHRIWLYPAGGGPARPAPSPAAVFPDNGGMEALAADPPRGPDAYIVGAEDSGQIWYCRISAACQEGPKLPAPSGFSLTAATRLSNGRMAWLLRAFDPLRGARAELMITDDSLRVIDRLRLEPPTTVDNMEGVAAAEGRDGLVRFYLLSDDNFSARQRTLLLAYDWRPPAGR